MVKKRVLQWATGTTGRLALRAVIDADDLELAGVRVYDPRKVGVDAGDLVDRGRTGVIAIGTREAAMAVEADVVLYMGRVETDKEACFRDVIELLRAGRDVIATGSSFIDSRTFAPEWIAGLEEACRRGSTRFVGVGLFPGFWGESLAPVLSRLASRCRRITIRESLSYAGYPGRELIFDIMGYGQLPGAESKSAPDPGLAAAVFQSTVDVLAKALGLKAGRIEGFRQTVATDTTLEIAAGVIPAGTVAAIKVGAHAQCGPLEIVVEHVTWMSPAVAPEWSALEGYDVEFDGDPALVCHVTVGHNDVDRTEQACLATAMHAVNAIRVLPGCSPGVLDLADLPPFTARFG